GPTNGPDHSPPVLRIDSTSFFVRSAIVTKRRRRSVTLHCVRYAQPISSHYFVRRLGSHHQPIAPAISTFIRETARGHPNGVLRRVGWTKLHNAWIKS